MTFLIKTVVKYLRDTADQIEQGKCDLTNEQAMEIMSAIAHESMSRTQACKFLNVNKSRFFELISQGAIPKGRKVLGFTELRWYKDELIQAINNNRTSE